MLFKKANGHVYDVDVSKASFVILSPWAGADSVLAQFTNGEIGNMMQWARTQQSADGSINLMNWPGWQEACERLHLDAGRAREVAAALLVRLGASSTL